MKTKTSIWLSICTLVLCLGAMVTGIYSAITATLNIGGKLGFNMHNALVEVRGNISNIAELLEDGTYIRTSKPIQNAVMGSESSTTTTNINLGKLEFFIGYDMIFDLTFTNLGDMAIKADLSITYENENVELTQSTDYVSMPYSTQIEPNASTRICFALTLTNQTAQIENFDFTINGSFNEIVFEHDIVQPEILEAVLTDEGYVYDGKYLLTKNEGEKTYTARLMDDIVLSDIENYYIPSKAYINGELCEITVMDVISGLLDHFNFGTNIYTSSGIKEFINIKFDSFSKVELSKNITKLSNCKFNNIGFVNFSNGCKNITIDQCIFENMYGLVISDDDTNIIFADTMFAGMCLYINQTTPPTGITFDEYCWFNDAVIYVPTGYEQAYKESPNFAEFADYIYGYDFSAE